MIIMIIFLGEEILKVDSIEILGIVIDGGLTWKDHEVKIWKRSTIDLIMLHNLSMLCAIHV